MFFELSNTMNNMQNLGNLYENNTDKIVSAMDVVEDISSDSY